MDWIVDLLKHMAISRSIVAAVFVTAVVMVVGQHLFPNLVPSVPQPWAPMLFGVMVLTGTLLMFWAIAIAWSSTLRFFSSATTNTSPPELNNNHHSLLAALGKNPSEPLNLDNINYESAPFSKLEVLQWVSELEKNNMVSTNPWNENLVTLTQIGREQALKIERSQGKNA